MRTTRPTACLPACLPGAHARRWRCVHSLGPCLVVEVCAPPVPTACLPARLPAALSPEPGHPTVSTRQGYRHHRASDVLPPGLCLAALSCAAHGRVYRGMHNGRVVAVKVRAGQGRAGQGGQGRAGQGRAGHWAALPSHTRQGQHRPGPAGGAGHYSSSLGEPPTLPAAEACISPPSCLPLRRASALHPACR